MDNGGRTDNQGDEPQMNAQELNAKLATITDRLSADLSSAYAAEHMVNFLKTAAKFYTYSLGNQLAIAWQCPTATRVAGYKTWQALGRQVRKGEKGIAILAPMPKRVTADDGSEVTRVFFKTVYVFDVAQTDGDELPATPEWTTRERDAELHARLLAFAATLGVTVTERTFADGTEGRATEGKTIELAPNAGTRVFIHELAHILMHQGEGAMPIRLALGYEGRELEAESVAYVVASHFGLDVATSPNYLALVGIKPDELKSHMGRVSECARQIIAGAAQCVQEGEPVA